MQESKKDGVGKIKMIDLLEFDDMVTATSAKFPEEPFSCLVTVVKAIVELHDAEGAMETDLSKQYDDIEGCFGDMLAALLISVAQTAVSTGLFDIRHCDFIIKSAGGYDKLMEFSEDSTTAAKKFDKSKWMYVFLTRVTNLQDAGTLEGAEGWAMDFIIDILRYASARGIDKELMMGYLRAFSKNLSTLDIDQYVPKARVF